MLTCRELADFIAEYLSGEIPDETRAAFDEHLAGCSNCRSYLASYKATVALGRRAFDDDDAEVPPDVPEELVRAILASRKQ